MAEIGRQIGMLGDRIGERPIDPGISQLEAQVRQLVARMDQTGEQLSGLAKLYAEPAPQVRLPEIDYRRDGRHGRHRAPPKRCRGSRRTAALADTIAGLEQRITAMLQGMQQHDPEVSDFGGMQAGINEVNDRLRRLEASLLERTRVDRCPIRSRTSDIAAIIAEADAHVPAAPPRPRDAMPRRPADDAPLTAPAFPDPDAGRSRASRWRASATPASMRTCRSPPATMSKPPAPTPSAGFEPPPATDTELGFFEPACAGRRAGDGRGPLSQPCRPRAATPSSKRPAAPRSGRPLRLRRHRHPPDNRVR